MRIHHSPLLIAVVLAGAPGAPAAAQGGTGLTAIPDSELAQMRGRYTVGNNAVAWFGVSMVSTWRTASGQTLKGTMTLAMDFSKSATAPTISFVPTVTITAADAPMPATGDVVRSVDASGLANVSGMSQSVQVAGDANLAHNLVQLDVHDGAAPTGTTAGIDPDAAQNLGNATATAGFQDNTAAVQLTIEGQGAVRQWIGNGSLGQSIQLTSDYQQVSNQLQIDLVRQTLGANAQLAQNVAQAISMTRGIPGGI